LQIIVIPGRVAKPRSITLSLHHFVLAFLLVGLVTTSVAIGLYWLTLRLGPSVRLPVLAPIIDALQRTESERSRTFLQRNLNAMAVKLGEMQAQLTRLDALGERLSSITGIKPQEFKFTQSPGLGGPQSTMIPPQDLTLDEFEQRLLALSRDLENRGDMLSLIDAQLFEQTVQKKLLPTISPVSVPFNASGFGYRIDPFTGQRTLHEGIDFIADIGTPIVSAAGGVVVFAGSHPQYGMMVEIDHGNDLSTRYAHLSRIQVREGDVVHRGKRIAESGNSGRSTGPHLHFEVRFRGAAQNPARFLEVGKTAAKVAERATNKARN
jgi:murein DD-endopeptidase MepM/ murein hydrolase activator NlpD